MGLRKCKSHMILRYITKLRSPAAAIAHPELASRSIDDSPSWKAIAIPPAPISVRSAIAVATTVACAVAIAEWASCAVWAICVRAELLRELLLLSDGILDSLLLGSNIVLVLLLLGGNKVLVLLLLSLHELLAFLLGLGEGLLFGLTDFADLLGGHAVWAVWVGARVAVAGMAVCARVAVAACVAVWEKGHCVIGVPH